MVRIRLPIVLKSWWFKIAIQVSIGYKTTEYIHPIADHVEVEISKFFKWIKTTIINYLYRTCNFTFLSFFFSFFLNYYQFYLQFCQVNGIVNYPSRQKLQLIIGQVPNNKISRERGEKNKSKVAVNKSFEVMGQMFSTKISFQVL